MNDIQTSLRQWSGSTLHKAHRELGEKAAERIDELEAKISRLEFIIRAMRPNDVEAREKEYDSLQSSFKDLDLDWTQE